MIKKVFFYVFFLSLVFACNARQNLISKAETIKNEEAQESTRKYLLSKDKIFVKDSNLIVLDFSPTQKLPEVFEVPINELIKISFNSPIDLSTLKGISVTRNGAPGYPEDCNWSNVSGHWIGSSNNTVLAFTSDAKFTPGELIIVKIGSALKSQDGHSLSRDSESLYSFITDNNVNYQVTRDTIPQMAIVQNDDGSDHILPLELIVPNTGKKVPIMFWVHGGGWGGGNSGSMNASDLRSATYPDYLSRKLGVAIANVSWRSATNSEGTFQKAMTDVALAIKYVRDHADVYGIDTSRMGLYGGSAGTPMSSLMSQIDTGFICYVGFNGLYDFVKRTKPYGFGGGTGFNQNIPSLEANSAINHIHVPGPNTLLLHGDMDVTIEYLQSIYYAEAINAAGGNAKALIYKGESHAFFNPGNPAHIPTMYVTGMHLQSTFFGDGCSQLRDLSQDELNKFYPSKNIIIKYHGEWTRKHYPERIAEFKKDPLNFGDIVFIGNSITEGGKDWSARFNIPDIRNRGISGDVTDGILNRLDEIVYCKPKAVFLLIGINDLFNLNSKKEIPSAEYVGNNIMKIVKIIHEKTPKTKIYVQTLLPTDKIDMKEDIMVVNNIIKRNEKNGLYKVIDLHSVFTNKKGLIIKDYTRDGVHPNETGYDLWVEYEKNTVEIVKFGQ
jgi:lysophospholipase L1-like esterase/acetyl esterase/lipase